MTEMVETAETPPKDSTEARTEELEALARHVLRRRIPLPPPSDDAVPAWAKVPGVRGDGTPFVFPKGRQVVFLRFRAEWTDTPSKGERQCILWPLSEADEKISIARAQQDVNRLQGEMSKQMIRVVDGAEADWSGVPGPANIDRWWDEIGSRCRSQITRLHMQLHTLNEDEQTDFFENCIAVRTAG